MSNKFLSIIIPAYNEEKRLARTLEKIGQFLTTKTYSSEVLIVDDGSTDDTLQVASEYIKKFENLGISLRILQNATNCGKGYTIRNGVLQAIGEIAIFTDADLSTPITELDKLINPIVVREKDIVFGSRALPESKITTHQPSTRELAGRIFNQLMKFVTGLPYQDTQCGFKAFHRNRTSWIFEKQKIFGFGFDVEVLFIAQKHGLRCLEMPVIWADVAGTKVSTLKGISAFLELLLIRWHHLLGRYTPSAEVISTSAADTN